MIKSMSALLQRFDIQREGEDDLGPRHVER